MSQKILSHKRTSCFDRFWFGVCYYPEHWSEEDRLKDADLMSEAGVNVVRMAEFAWDIMEPEEGTFDFSFFDEVIETLGKKGISTILCTPTAAPPRWLTFKHPELLRVNENGKVMQHGSRQHCEIAHPLFREYSRKITKAMATHFKGNDYVIGWQTDNELNCHFTKTHTEAARLAFVEFLRGKFNNDISRLNDAWGTSFWALSFRSFEEIELPKDFCPAFPNPAQVLDYYRFLSSIATDFQRDQVKILKKVNSNWFVTHNGIFSYLDYRGDFTKDLDVLGFDCYPFFNDAEIRESRQAFTLDRARAFSGNFIIPEQQSGPGGQAPYMHNTPEPGEMRKMNYVSIARGADSLLHFRWRTCRFGAEEYWCGVLAHDNVPRRRYQELKQFGAEINTLGQEILGTHVAVDVAVAGAEMLVDCGHEIYSLGLPGPGEIGALIHREFYNQGYSVGVVHPEDDLDDVKLYFIPHWQNFDPAWAEKLFQYVEDGGVLVIGARTATKDMDNNVVGLELPGVLKELAGITVVDYSRQNTNSNRPLYLELNEQKVEVQFWFEELELDAETEAVALWNNRYLKGKNAISRHRYGKGQVFYVGTYFTEALLKELCGSLINESKLEKTWHDVPCGVEVVKRQSDSKIIWFFINHNEYAVEINSLPEGQIIVGSNKIEPNDVMIVKTML